MKQTNPAAADTITTNSRNNQREIYLICVLVLLFSIAGFVFDEITAQLLTSILHDDVTDMNSLAWYWQRYAFITRVLCGISAVLSGGYMAWARYRGLYYLSFSRIYLKITGTPLPDKRK